MLKNISESITNFIKLLVSVTQLAMLLAVIGGGWWAYTKVTSFLSSPISLPDINVPKVHIEAPDIELPSIKLPGQKPEIDTSKWHDPDTNEYMAPVPPKPPGTPPPSPRSTIPDMSDIQV